MASNADQFKTLRIGENLVVNYYSHKVLWLSVVYEMVTFPRSSFGDVSGCFGANINMREE